MYKNEKILIGKTEKNEEVYLLPSMASRHGIITGASGSGKTVTLKVMAESFSEANTPVLLIDIKGDLAATCKMGLENDNINKRVDKLELEDFSLRKFPVVFWDIYGKNGHPIRTTVSSLGVRLMSKMLLLNESQEEILTVVFKIATDEELELIDLDDLREMLSYVNSKRKEYSEIYGNITTQSITTIQRAVLTLKENGGDFFFGEPSLDIKDFMKFDSNNGYGNINILDATTLYKNPRLYSVIVLWLLNTLFDKMEEVGESEKAKLVFFIDEAHLLFSEMDSNITKQIVQIVKLIRSKAVGLYFVSQNPSDINEEILGQLGNKIQHVLRCYTKSEEKTVKTVANSFRTNPSFDNFEIIKTLGTGEALVSFINEKQEPGISQKVTILPPQSKMGTITYEERKEVINASRFNGKYDEKIKRETTKDILKKIKVEEKKEIKEETKEETKKTTTKKTGKSSTEKAKERVINSALSTIGRGIGRGLLNIFKK